MAEVLEIDVSQVLATVEKLKLVMTVEGANEVLRRTFMDAGRKVKTIMRTEVPKEYEAKANWVGRQVGFPQQGGGGGSVSVVIPISGVRGVIGKDFKASGGRGRPAKGKRRKIVAKIVKGQGSTLPAKMEHQGGQPPFLAGGIAYTRKYAGKARPIVRVVGLAVPQMPLNRSENDVREEINKVLWTRLQHHFWYLLGK